MLSILQPLTAALLTTLQTRVSTTGSAALRALASGVSAGPYLPGKREPASPSGVETVLAPEPDLDGVVLPVVCTP